MVKIFECMCDKGREYMNWSVFKDFKFLLRFSLAILFNALGIIFAVLSYLGNICNGSDGCNILYDSKR